MKKLLLLVTFLICTYSIGYSQCTPSVEITSDHDVICVNSQIITFTATPTNGGASPLYEWFVGNNSQGIPSTQSTFIPTLTPSSNTVSVKMTSNASCASTLIATSNIVTINVLDYMNSSTIGSDQTICYNSFPSAITQITNNGAVIPVYYWESSVNGSDWTMVSGATNSSYTFPVPLTNDIFIRRVTMDMDKPAPCNTSKSNTVKITVLPIVTAGVISGDQTTCQGASPTTITNTVLPTGGQATFTYVWESSIDVNGPFSPAIPAGTGSTYAPGNLTTTTYYRRKEINACQTVFSNVVTKTVTAYPATSVDINHPGEACSGTIMTLTAIPINGGSAPSYQWYLGTTPVGTNSETFNYTTSTLDNGKYITVQITPSEACTYKATSSAAFLNIVASTTPTVSVQANNNPNCAGLLSTFSVNNSTGAGNAPIYEWYVNFEAVATGATFSSPSLVDGDYVWVEMTSSLNCIIGANRYTSNKILIVIKPIPDPIVTVPHPYIDSDNQTVCAGESFTFTSYVNASISATYQWRKDGIAIPQAINATYTATQAGSYTITEDNGACKTTSPAVTLTIDPCGGFSSSINGPDPITPGQQNAVYSVVKQTGFSYAWTITGGTIVSGQNTNSVTVDWDAPAATSAVSRISAPAYSISVTETNTSNQKKTTTIDVSPTATSISKSLAQSGITLFPNPTAESFNIQMPESGVAVSYEILDLTGASVAKGNFTSTGTAEKITANFGAGMYQVVLRYKDVVTCGRLSKVQ